MVIGATRAYKTGGTSVHRIFHDFYANLCVHFRVKMVE